jgi:phage shock protein A
MFENLRNAFREAVDNFNKELNRDAVPEAIDGLLKGMRDEVTDAKTRLHDLEEGIRRARAEAEREGRELETCRRRETMAEKIGDDETAQIAREYGEKHARRKEVLEKKAAALEEELRIRRAEIEEMLDKIREAQKNRDTLAATAGRASARESIRGTEDLFDELDRMAERISGDDERRKAADEILRDLDSDESDLHLDLDDPYRPPPDVDSRLEELKRRMGEGE